MGKITYQAADHSLFVGRECELVAGRAEQPVERTVGLEQGDAPAAPRTPPVVRPVEIPEVNPIVEIHLVPVLVRQRVINEDVVIRGYEDDVAQFACPAQGAHKLAVERGLPLKPGIEDFGYEEGQVLGEEPEAAAVLSPVLDIKVPEAFLAHDGEVGEAQHFFKRDP